MLSPARYFSATAWLAWPLARLAARRYAALPALPGAPIAQPLPSLSVVIPARNEAANLALFLPGLMALPYPGEREVIVVDDGSDDETAAVAAVHGARVVVAGSPPPGWLGKPWACQVGAQAARGEWLLFTDADVRHLGGGPAAVVAYAGRRALDGLSLFPDQAGHALWPRVSLGVAFAGLFAGLRSATPVLNGQYILLRREVYFDSGGFAVVAGEPLEDLALGRHLQGAGRRVPALRGEQVAAVQVYRDLPSLWRGLNRLGAGSLRWEGPGALVTIALITSAAAPMMGLLSRPWRRGRRDTLRVLLAWTAVGHAFLPWGRALDLPRLPWLAPAGALLVQVAALWGLLRRRIGHGVLWKGRRV